MKEKELNNIIEKYLKGTASQGEIDTLKKFEKFAKNKITHSVFKSDLEKKSIKQDIFTNIKRSNISKKSNFHKYAIAASIVVFISVFVFNIKNGENQKSIVNNIVKEAKYGQKFEIILPDGSKVFLNSGSKIIYPEKFTKNSRAVTLEGEAFFDVIKNPKKPFVITSSNLKTTVLGTTFNVEAYSELKEIKVTLATGKVSIDVAGKNVILFPAQQAVFSKTNKIIKTHKVDLAKYLDWKNNVLRFENATLGEAVKKLEKWYNVDIELENENLSECKFTGTFKNEDLKTVLESLIFVKEGMNYVITPNNKVILKGNCNN
jgi:ferric-dicitrate binding protein FerR (iron transport regulator)